MNVGKPSVKTQAWFFIRGSILERDLMGVKSVVNPLVKVHTLLDIWGSILERNPSNVMNVRGPSLRGQDSWSIREVTLERSPIRVRSVGKLSEGAPALLSTWGSTLGRSPISVRNADEPSFRDQALFVIRGSTEGRSLCLCPDCKKAFNHKSSLTEHFRKLCLIQTLSLCNKFKKSGISPLPLLLYIVKLEEMVINIRMKEGSNLSLEPTIHILASVCCGCC